MKNNELARKAADELAIANSPETVNSSEIAAIEQMKHGAVEVHDESKASIATFMANKVMMTGATASALTLGLTALPAGFDVFLLAMGVISLLMTVVGGAALLQLNLVKTYGNGYENDMLKLENRFKESSWEYRVIEGKRPDVKDELRIRNPFKETVRSEVYVYNHRDGIYNKVTIKRSSFKQTVERTAIMSDRAVFNAGLSSLKSSSPQRPQPVENKPRGTSGRDTSGDLLGDGRAYMKRGLDDCYCKSCANIKAQIVSGAENSLKRKEAMYGRSSVKMSNKYRPLNHNYGFDIEED